MLAIGENTLVPESGVSIRPLRKSGSLPGSGKPVGMVDYSGPR